MEEKTPWSHKLCAFRCLNSNILVRSYFCLKNYITSEGAVSHEVLATALHCSFQVSFNYGNNYFVITDIAHFFLKNYVNSEGAVSHNVLYYQQLSIAR